MRGDDAASDRDRARPGGKGDGMGPDSEEAVAIAAGWLADLREALESTPVRLGEMLDEHVVWRDLLALQWDFSNVQALSDAEAAAERLDAGTGMTSLRFDDEEPVRVDTGGDAPAVQVFFRFEGRTGPCVGYARLVRVGGEGWRAVSVLTELDGLHGHPERIGAARPAGRERGPVRGRESWSRARARRQEYADRDPDVVVVGGGHSGLAIAARLQQLGLRILILERNQRIGDNWRHRYPSLALHDPVGAEHLPYLPFPPNWPVYAPGDKLGDFLEFYASAMELDVWTGVEVEQPRHDPARSVWSIPVTRADGTARVLHPRHLVMATGFTGPPRVPELEGADAFGGQVLHSSAFPGGDAFAGRRVAVIGAGVSGHDICQDLWEHGVDVTMIQRSSTYVIDQPTHHRFYSANYLEGVMPIEHADLISAANPVLVSVAGAPRATRLARELDRELLDGLAAHGFAIDFGPDDEGFLGKSFRLGKQGFYYNVGASNLIATGEIPVRSGHGVAALAPGGVVLDDGSTVPADDVIFATGYTSMSDAVREVLGDELTDRIAPLYVVDEHGEQRGLWRRSGHDGLWFMSGSFTMARIYSKLLALHIAAFEFGITDATTTAHRTA